MGWMPSFSVEGGCGVELNGGDVEGFAGEMAHLFNHLFGCFSTAVR